jgi:glutamate racemase
VLTGAERGQLERTLNDIQNDTPAKPLAPKQGDVGSGFKRHVNQLFGTSFSTQQDNSQQTLRAGANFALEKAGLPKLQELAKLPFNDTRLIKADKVLREYLYSNNLFGAVAKLPSGKSEQIDHWTDLFAPSELKRFINGMEKVLLPKAVALSGINDREGRTMQVPKGEAFKQIGDIEKKIKTEFFGDRWPDAAKPMLETLDALKSYTYERNYDATRQRLSASGGLGILASMGLDFVRNANPVTVTSNLIRLDQEIARTNSTKPLEQAAAGIAGQFKDVAVDVKDLLSSLARKDGQEVRSLLAKKYDLSTLEGQNKAVAGINTLLAAYGGAKLTHAGLKKMGVFKNPNASALVPVQQTPSQAGTVGRLAPALQQLKSLTAQVDDAIQSNNLGRLQQLKAQMNDLLGEARKLGRSSGDVRGGDFKAVNIAAEQALKNIDDAINKARVPTPTPVNTTKPATKPVVTPTNQAQPPVVPTPVVNTPKTTPKTVAQPTPKPTPPVLVAPVPGNVPIEPAISTSGVRIYKLQDGNVGSVSLSQSGQGDVVPKNSNTAVKPKPNDDDNPWGMSLGPDGQPRITPQRASQPPTSEDPTTGNNNNQPPNKPPTKKTGGTPPDDDSSISKSPNNTQKPTPTSTPTVRSQAVATGDAVVKTVDLFTKPGSALTPDMQFKLNPMLSKFMDRFDGRDFKLVLADSSAGGRVAAPNLLNGFQEATGTLPSTAVFGDDRFAPYGVLTPDELRLRTNDMFTVGNALDPDCTAGVCNTFHIAVDSGLNALESPYSAPYVHLIRTTAYAMKEAVANGDTKPVLLATPATVDSGIYTRHIDMATDGQLKVIQIPAKDFAPAVNNADHLQPPGSPKRIALDQAADEYVRQIPADATSVWLCCTHYPALTSTIREALDRAGKGHIKIVDPMREQGYQVAEEFWEWKLAGGAKTPGQSFDTFMVSSGPQENMPDITRIGNQFFNQGDPSKPTIPVITPGAYGETTPEAFQQAINTLPGRKPEINPSRLPVQSNTPTGNQTPPVNAANVPSAEVPQNTNPPVGGNPTAQATPVWNQPGLSAANQKSIADSYAKYQQAGGTKTPEQFFNGTPQDPGVMQIFDEAKFLRGQAPSIPAIAETMATNQVAAAAFVAKEQALLNDAYESYSLTAQYHPYRDKAPVLDPEPFVTKVSQEYLAAGGKDSTGKTLGEFAVEKYPPLATSAFFQNPLEMAKRFPHLPLDERDKIVSLAQKTELLQREIIPHYKANPIIENGQKLVWHNPVTNRLEVDSNFLVYDPRANGVFPDGTKPAMDLNALIGRTDRYDLPSKLVQITIPATRPASVDPATNNQYIRPGFEHTNNKWVLSATENAYLPKVFAADPRLQAIEAQKKAVQANRGLSNHQIRTEVASLDAQAAPIKAELTETYLAKRRNWASFVIHALEVLRLPRTEVAAMLADQQIPSPPPPIGGPRSINVPQMAGSGVQPVKDPVTGLNTVTYVDLRNIKPQELARGDFSSADIETRGPSFAQAVSNSNHRRLEVTKNAALIGLSLTGAGFLAANIINPHLLKKPDPVPTPPIERLAASVTESNRTMLGLALQRGILQNKLDRITLPKVGLSLYLSPVGNLPKGADRPTFVQLVETLMQTNPQILKESGVDTTKLLESARQLDAAKVQTGSGTTIPPQPKKTP